MDFSTKSIEELKTAYEICRHYIDSGASSKTNLAVMDEIFEELFNRLEEKEEFEKLIEDGITTTPEMPKELKKAISESFKRWCEE